MRAAESGTAVGYGEDMVYKIEGGKRIPRQDYLVRADEVLGAGGLIAATWEDVKQQAVEIGVYECTRVHGLLQTPDHARALFEAAQPPYSPEDVERMVAARMARQTVFERDPAPSLHYVLEEAVVRRRVGGRMVCRGQLERLLEVGRFRNVTLQIMPTETDAHPGAIKSSYSSGTDGNSCAEVAITPGTVHVRDSKHTQGDRLGLSDAARRFELRHPRGILLGSIGVAPAPYGRLSELLGRVLMLRASRRGDRKRVPQYSSP